MKLGTSAATLRRTEQRGNSFYYLLSCRNLTGPHHKQPKHIYANAFTYLLKCFYKIHVVPFMRKSPGPKVWFWGLV